MIDELRAGRMGDEPERIGSHLFLFEPPDTVLVRIRGMLDEESVRVFIDRMGVCAARSGYLLILVGFTHAESITSEARRAGAGKKSYTPRGIAIFGASRTLRIVANFAVLASNLMNRLTDQPIRFTATEEEARAWISERREKISTDRR